MTGLTGCGLDGVLSLSESDGFRFLLIFDFGHGQAGQGLGTDRKAMDREVGEEGMAVEGGVWAARGGAGRTWRLELGWRGVAGLDVGTIEEGPEQSRW